MGRSDVQRVVRSRRRGLGESLDSTLRSGHVNDEIGGEVPSDAENGPSQNQTKRHTSSFLKSVLLLSTSRTWCGNQKGIMLPQNYFLTFLAAQTSFLPVSQAGDSSPGSSKCSIIQVDKNPTTSLDTTAWALIYTYPLAIFANFVGSVLQHVGVNELYHQRQLASLTDSAVIKPNVDTLYSRVALDLSEHNVELTIPEIAAGRYWNYPAYDAFGNVVAEIGIVNGNKAGKYLLRRADDVLTTPGYQNSSSNDDDSLRWYQGVVNMPTTYGTMLIRLLVLQNVTSDLNILHGYQNATKLTPLKRPASTTPQTSQAPPLNSTGFDGALLGIQTPERQLEFAARLVAHNQPAIYSERYRVASILARAGLYDGHYAAPSNVNLTRAASVANASITADVESHARDEGNGWQLQAPSYQGNYGTHYAAAAYVALYGYQQLTTRQSLYPGYGSLGFTSVFHPPAGGSVLFEFSAKPVLHTLGFWSLTVYGSDQYLIPNPLGRFEVGDRTHSLRYRDGGGLVYGPNATGAHDGPFQVLAQSASKTPPANWTGNWLPVDDTFSIILRWYVPQPAMTNGSYVYPRIQNISAIV